MSNDIRHVLFICTGNSARSIMAEGLLNHMAPNRFKAFSAGSQPRGQVHPLALSTLRNLHIAEPEGGFRSKSWDEFAQSGAPHMDFVFTVCDNAAGEVCPHWPGQPMTAHWGVYDPAAVEGSPEQQLAAFNAVALILKRRLELMLALPMASLDKMAIERHLTDIGQQHSPE
jgi:arsenate reductase (thioredoxin)